MMKAGEEVRERVARLEVRVNNIEADVSNLVKTTSNLSKAVIEIKTALALWKWFLPIILSVIVAFIVKYLP